MKMLKYTNVQEDIGGVKRLSFIVSTINNVAEGKLKILDVGCGTGPVTIPLGLTGHDILGIDIDDESISIAKERNPFANVEFKKSKVEAVKDKFDVIICTQVIEHIEQPQTFIESMREKLRDNGILIITTPNGYGPSELLGEIARLLRKTFRLKPSKFSTNKGKFTSNTDNPHVQRYTTKKLMHIFGNAGMTCAKQRSHTFLLSAFPFTYFFFLTPKSIARMLERIDTRMADLLPHALSSGWYFILRRT